MTNYSPVMYFRLCGHLRQSEGLRSAALAIRQVGRGGRDVFVQFVGDGLLLGRQAGGHLVRGQGQVEGGSVQLARLLLLGLLRPHCQGAERLAGLVLHQNSFQRTRLWRGGGGRGSLTLFLNGVNLRTAGNRWKKSPGFYP